MRTNDNARHSRIRLLALNRKCPTWEDRVWWMAEWIDRWLAPRMLWFMFGMFFGYLWMVTAYGLWP